nr:putative peptidoglycan-binding domain-containing protein [Desulfobaculum xiamenense]
MNRDGTVTWQNVAAMDAAQAADIYRRYFWYRLRLDDVVAQSWQLAPVLFDTAVNVGRRRTAVWLQVALNERRSSLRAVLRVDGDIGPNTLSVLGRANRDGHGLGILDSLLMRRVSHYTRLAARDWARTFLLGWLNRTIAVREGVR